LSHDILNLLVVHEKVVVLEGEDGDDDGRDDDDGVVDG
jgi:hypothetical protein